MFIRSCMLMYQYTHSILYVDIYIYKPFLGCFQFGGIDKQKKDIRIVI